VRQRNDRPGVFSFTMLAFMTAGPWSVSACPGDCSGDLRVSVDEVVACVGVALGRADAGCGCDSDGDGSVAIEELVTIVRVGLQDVVVTASGTCMRPGSGPGGLQPCDPGTDVTLSRCRDRAACLSSENGRTRLDDGSVRQDGSFSLATCDAVGATLVFEAQVGPASASPYRVLSFGPLQAGAGGGTRGSVPLDAVEISPRSEAGVRVIEASGLESLSDDGVAEILATVEEQTAGIDFSNLEVDEAADAATSSALEDEKVQSAVESNRITATPTPTATPTGTSTFTPTRMPAQVNVTAEGAVVASSVFPGNDFPASLAVDGSRLTSWFSNGAGDGPTETFRWTGQRDDVIASVAILSNAQHPQFPGFGFGSVQIEVRDASDGVVFGETRTLPGATDPDVTVSPNVVGRSVLLTFTGHDDPTCGGFSELVITALR
jgi:hypothetical protein